MTFENIRAELRAVWELPADARFRPAFERSLRRALHSLVRDQVLISIGNGGPGDPLRYMLHPFAVAFLGGDKASEDALMAAMRDADGAKTIVRGL